MTVSPESLGATINAFYQANPEALLVGSLGRSAIYSRIYGDPEREFAQRGEHPLWSEAGSPRDLDFIVTGDISSTSTNPYQTDVFCFRKPDFSLEREGADWWVTSEMHRYSERLHPAVMEPTPAKTVYDIDCLIPPLQTFQRLAGVPIIVRKKDIASLKIMETALEFEPNRLPEELYRPIDSLKEIAEKGIYPKLLRSYHAVVPLQARLALRPYVRGLKESIVLKTKETP